MKKFSPLILVVALLSLLSLTSRALPFVPTTDPLSSTTHWYQIKTENVYLYADFGDPWAIYATPTASTADDYLWCFVGDESTGYKVYNRASQCYIRRCLYANGVGNEADISYVEVESENSFAIYYINSDNNRKYYLVYRNNQVWAANGTSDSFTAVEVTLPLPIPGDVTGDGQVDITDVNAIINMLLGKATQTSAGDMTGDGTIDISDVNVVINIVLGKTEPPAGDPTAQSLTATGYNTPGNIHDNASEAYTKLVDGDKSTKWVVVNSSGTWQTIYIDLKSDVAFKPTSYILTTGYDTPSFYTRNPKNWKIYGRNSESESWTELAHVPNGAGLGNASTTDYTFEFNGITRAYQYYRFEVIEIGGKDVWDPNNYVFQLAELTLLGY